MAATPTPQDDAPLHPVHISFELETATDLSGSETDSDKDSDCDSAWSEPEESGAQKSPIPITPDTPAWPPAWPPDAVSRSFPPRAADKRPPPEPIKPHPIMVAKYSDLSRITATTPCRYKFVFPLQLPPLIDSSMAPPPYYPPNLVTNHMDKAKRILRPVIASALLAVLGPDAPVDGKLLPPVKRNAFPGTWLHDTVLCNMIDDPDKFHLDTGKWTDQCGHEGEVIDAYQDFGEEGIAVFYAYEFRVDMCIGEKDVNPPVVFFEAMPELRNGRVAIVAEECDDGEREHINMGIRDREGFP